MVTDDVQMLQMASEARERKKKFSSSVEVLRFERTLELTRHQLRKTDNIAHNDVRHQSTLALMFSEARKSAGGVGHMVVDHKPSDSTDILPQTGRCEMSRELVTFDDAVDSSCLMSSVASTSTVPSVTLPSSVVMTSVAMTTPTTIPSFVAVTTVAKSKASSTVSEALATSCVSRLLASSTDVSASQYCSLESTVSTPSCTTAVMMCGLSGTATTGKSINSVARSADAVTLKLVDSVVGRSTSSTDAVTFAPAKSTDSVARLTDAGTVKSVDSVTVMTTRSVEVSLVSAAADYVTVSLKSLAISSPVPLSSVKSLSTVQSPSPSPKGHVTFSDHVTEIQLGAGKPQRVPPAPPPRKALKNVTTNACVTSSPNKPRDRPCSAMEPLAAGSVDARRGLPTVNGVGGRGRPLSMAPLATVDSDSDSTESQTGTIRRNTTTDKRQLMVDVRNGGRGRTPPPVPTRKTSFLTSTAAKNVDEEYSNLEAVRQECARLELVCTHRQLADDSGTLNGMKPAGVGGGAVKCEETEIY